MARLGTTSRSARTVLGSESGSNVFDFDGSIERRYQELKAKGEVNYESLLTNTDIREDEIEMGQVSPRVFEAAAQWTAMILLKGRYSGVVRPGEHYIELERNFGNIDEVLCRVQDLDAMEAMVTRAHDHLIKSGAFSYRGFVQKVESAIVWKHRKLRGASAVRAAPYPRGSEGVTDFGPDTDVVGEYPTAAPQGIVYYYYKRKSLESSIYKRELDRLSSIYLQRIEQLQATYGEDRFKLLAEVQRLHKVYGEATLQRETGIERLNSITQQYNSERLQAVYGEAKEELLAEIRRLHAVYGEDKKQSACRDPAVAGSLWRGQGKAACRDLAVACGLRRR